MKIFLILYFCGLAFLTGWAARAMFYGIQQAEVLEDLMAEKRRYYSARVYAEMRCGKADLPLEATDARE